MPENDSTCHDDFAPPDADPHDQWCGIRVNPKTTRLGKYGLLGKCGLQAMVQHFAATLSPS